MSPESTPTAVSENASGTTAAAAIPVAVDLDGTLVRTDLLFECLFRIAKQKPWLLAVSPLWLIRGKAYLKRRAFEAATLDVSLLPLNQSFVDWLREEKARGRRLILTTAANQELAESAVARLELFDAVLGSDSKHNLKGPAKAVALSRMFESGFAYAGNSSADCPVWKASAEAIVVNASPWVRAEAERTANVTKVFDPPGKEGRALFRSMRPYQWIKNLLIFVPAFTSHEVIHAHVLMQLLMAFAAFCLCASGTYVFNDLLDLEEDRMHRSKKYRPFASGDCSIRLGLAAVAGCLTAGMALAFVAGGGFPVLLLLYILVTTLYSIRIKKMFLLDVLTLAILYTVRVIAGHIVTGIPFSIWLLSFAFFLFLSLAFCKRATELFKLARSEERGAADTIPGRGYRSIDLQIISTAGLCSGFLSTLVFALYINSEAVTLLYRRPALLWGILPLLLYYIVRIWIICGRGELEDDPIVYTAKSPSTYYIAALVVLIVVAATVNF